MHAKHRLARENKIIRSLQHALLQNYLMVISDFDAECNNILLFNFITYP